MLNPTLAWAMDNMPLVKPWTAPLKVSFFIKLDLIQI